MGCLGVIWNKGWVHHGDVILNSWCFLLAVVAVLGLAGEAVDCNHDAVMLYTESLGSKPLALTF